MVSEKAIFRASLCIAWSKNILNGVVDEGSEKVLKANVFILFKRRHMVGNLSCTNILMGNDWCP